MDFYCYLLLKHRKAVHNRSNNWCCFSCHIKSAYWRFTYNYWFCITRHDSFLELQRSFWKVWIIVLYVNCSIMWWHGLWFLLKHNLMFSIFRYLFFIFILVLCNQLGTKHIHGYCWRQFYLSKVQEKLFMALRWWTESTSRVSWRKRRTWTWWKTRKPKTNYCTSRNKFTYYGS